jgi:hypothetical protein
MVDLQSRACSLQKVGKFIEKNGWPTEISMMKKSQKLKKVIEYAIKRGYELDGLLEAVLSGRLGVGLGPNIYNHLIADKHYYNYIFTHDFAKAFWGKELGTIVYTLGGPAFKIAKSGTDRAEIPAWCWHLQQMVLKKDSIDYCYQFVKENEKNT